MTDTRNTLWCRLAIAVVAIGLCWSTASSSDSDLAASDPRRDMINMLPAPGPHASIAGPARAFDRFVGTWDCDYGFIAPDGSTKHVQGELIFGWIMDGHALQDLWISYPAGPSKERTIGTSVRFYDSKSGVWRVVFLAPTFGGLVTVVGGPTGNDRIVLRGRLNDGSWIRWSFNDIRNDSFVWRGETSYDDGETWQLQEEHHMKRRKPPANPS